MALLSKVLLSCFNAQNALISCGSLSGRCYERTTGRENGAAAILSFANSVTKLRIKMT